MRKFKLILIAVAVLLLPISNAYAFYSTQSDFELNLSARIRQYLSLNLQNPFPADHLDDQWQLSMVRTSVALFADGKIGKIGFHANGRLVREIETDYLRRMDHRGADLHGLLAYDEYPQNDIRELYFDVPLSVMGIPYGFGSKLRIGKQQVAFGNTDFFHVLDQVNGFDYTWRAFLVPENEEIRKPLVMANLIVNVPKWQGQAQFLVIPGALNRKRDYGNTYDIFGGRWANQPYKAVDFIHAGDGHPALVPYNYDSKGADTSDIAGGFRWSGHFGGSNYSLVYLYQHNGDPVFNSATNPYKQKPEGVLGDTIYPFVHIVGATANTFAAWADAVFSAELAYTFDKPYNVGTDPSNCAGNIPGLCGIKTKDTVQAVVRMDKNLTFLQGPLHTFNSPFFSLQLFDTWVPGLKGKDHIVDLAGFSAPKSQNTAIFTGILTLSYNHKIINPGLAGGVDLTHGGGFVIPSVDFHFGDHWRVKLEADLFFSDGSNKTGQDSSNTYLFGYFRNNDQLMTRVTYQF